MSEETVSHETNGSIFVSLKRRKEVAALYPEDEDEWGWFVQVSDATGSVDEDCADEHTARAFYRNICNQNGIKVGFQPLVFVTEQGLPTDPAQAALLVIQKWTEKLFRLQPGSEEALNMRNEMISDEEFQIYASSILITTNASTGWVAATIKASAKMAVSAASAVEANRRQQMLEDIPGFGEF